jgi:hypothetical protein
VALTIWLYKLRQERGKRRGFPYVKTLIFVFLAILIGRSVFPTRLVADPAVFNSTFQEDSIPNRQQYYFISFTTVVFTCVGIYFFYHLHANRKFELRSHVSEMIDQLYSKPSDIDDAVAFLKTYDFATFFGRKFPHLPKDVLDDVTLRFDKQVSFEIINKAYLLLLSEA